MTSAGAPAKLWAPSREQLEQAEIARYMRWAAKRSGSAFAGYEQLRQWSVRELEDFWASIWQFCGVRASRDYEQVLEDRRMPGARWFSPAQLNYAENLLLGPPRVHASALAGEAAAEDSTGDAHRGGSAGGAHRAGGAGAAPSGRGDSDLAVVHCSELRADGQLSWGELRARVAATAQGLRELGVQRGDRVVAYMPNIPETLIAFLATASIGAIWSSAAPEFGARSVIDRFAQIEPKVLLAVDGYRHGGKDFDRAEVARAILAELPSVQRAVVLSYLNASTPAHAVLPGALSFDELQATGAGAQLRFEQVPFDHPLWVLYSSGTTGLPKAIVHGHGGILLEQLKKRLHLDLRAGDRMFWFTTTGWMMWNFLVGCLHSDAAIVLYDGSPAHPHAGALFELAQRTGITCLGASAGLLAAAQKAGAEPGREYELANLRAIGSTGSPLAPESFRWVYEHVGSDVWLFSTSGGTDVCTAFVAGCPLLPVYEGELQCRALGCAVESWDERGDSLIEEVGELVITQPMPSMPLFFWGEDPPQRDGSGGERLRDSYFSMYPKVWRHGDWIRITARGGAVIYGRSDSTINRQGVRMGTSEIYRAAGALEQVLDALVVDVPRPGGAEGELWMVLFVVLREGIALDDDLAGKIKARIRSDVSPRHVPDEVLQVSEVPRTLSGKVLEVPVKRILMGTPPGEAASVESLANPAALDYFVQLARTLAAPAAARAGG